MGYHLEDMIQVLLTMGRPRSKMEEMCLEMELLKGLLGRGMRSANIPVWSV